MRLAGSLLICVLLSGCGVTAVYRSYEGATRPASEIAVVTMDDKVWVSEVDGKKTGLHHFNMVTKGTRLELTPGNHSIKARYSTGCINNLPCYYSGSDSEFSQEFKAGESYVFHYFITYAIRYPFDSEKEIGQMTTLVKKSFGVTGLAGKVYLTLEESQ